MTNPEQIAEARKTLEAKWDQEGDCGSCGWHALLYEHDVEDCDIIEALDGDGILHLGCRNKDDEDRWNHRGVKICIRPNNEYAARRKKGKAQEPVAQQELHSLGNVCEDACGQGAQAIGTGRSRGADA